jgi:pimeloyl-ACP methyl ester carboxylesterase
VATPDLPCDQVGLNQLDYASVVGPEPDAIVVGHSLAGQTIPHVKARTHVYLAAILPVENVYADAFTDRFGGMMRDELDRSYWPDADVTHEKLYPDCTREQSDWAFAQLRPQTRVTALVAPFGSGDVVIATMRDAVVDPEWQVRTAREHGARAIEIDAGHSPFLTHPDELAATLSSLA